MEDSRPASVGLTGNKDEFAAIEEIEAAFGVTIDYADAPKWRTAGDIYRSLLAQLPPGAADDPQTWPRFVAALTHDGDAEAAAITPDSPLTDEGQPWRGLNALSAMMAVLLIASVAIVVLLVLALR